MPNAKWYWKYRERDLARQKRYRQQHKQKVIDCSRRWLDSHPDKRRAYRRAYHERLRNQVLQMLGTRCAICGFADVRALQVDHVNGGGRQEKTGLHNPLALYRRILKVHGLGYRVLCANCNVIKAREQGEYKRTLINDLAL